MSVKAVGYYSREVYMVGKSKAEVLRKLQKKFPSFGQGKRQGTPSNHLYPEPLIIEE
ncbi:hypothetical protein R82265_HNDDMDAM_01454 [Fructobacillus cardui]|uniref:hypothetical protein n=1 Tax=Fructobacillus cardui TaxID=2893170 RepID=UPI002D885F78|nr:hypothetical protein R53653_IHELHDKM_00699 [Fructobacillus cardui]CAK1253819.1 hypothetical protein R82265_HNDDMDAM_01454 [Fructobacillus cardui]